MERTVGWVGGWLPLTLTIDLRSVQMPYQPQPTHSHTVHLPRGLPEQAAERLLPAADPAARARVHQWGHLPEPAWAGLAAQHVGVHAGALHPLHALLGQGEEDPAGQSRP